VIVQRYTADQQPQWDDFVSNSKNGTFLFFRGYMDYHRDRFPDHSLLVRGGPDRVPGRVRVRRGLAGGCGHVRHHEDRHAETGRVVDHLAGVREHPVLRGVAEVDLHGHGVRADRDRVLDRRRGDL